jgi:FtsZ-interacting cell division protein ZipA
VDENLPLILLVVCLVVIALIIFAVHRKKRQSQLRASMYRQWRDYPDRDGEQETNIAQEPHESSLGLSSALDAVGMDNILDDGIVSEVRVIRGAADSKPTQKPTPRSRYADLVVLYVMARPGKTFVGYELLQALSAAGLQYGDMNIFHQYASETDATQKQKILYSLASATEPGTFDLSEMGGVQCSGLCLFMDTKQIDHPIAAFEQMIVTVKQLADDLDGIAQEQRHEPLTEQCISVYRARVRSGAKGTISAPFSTAVAG